MIKRERERETYLQWAAVMTQLGLITVHPPKCLPLCWRLHCQGHWCRVACRPPTMRFIAPRWTYRSPHFTEFNDSKIAVQTTCIWCQSNVLLPGFSGTTTENFKTNLSYVNIYAKWQNVIQLFLTLTKLRHIKRNNVVNFYISIENCKNAIIIYTTVWPISTKCGTTTQNVSVKYTAGWPKKVVHFFNTPYLWNRTR